MSPVKKNRRPQNPIMRTADDAITYLVESSKPVDVSTITDNMLQRIRAKVVMDQLALLLRPFARSRAIQRGFKVTNAEDFDRGSLLDMGVDDFDETIKVKQRNVDDVQRHLRAEKDVRKYLAAQRTRLGREVTVSEFEDKVVAIYERHGVGV